MNPIEKLRFGARTAAFAATSGVLLAALYADQARADEAARHAISHRWTRRWARAVLRTFALQVEPSGRYLDRGTPYPPRSDNGVGRMFLFNHRSGMDIPVACRLVDAHFVSRHDLAQWPLMGPAARAVGTLFVDRSSKRSGAGVLREMVTTIEQGCAVGMFPEGTTFRGDEVRRLRVGAFKAAQQTGAEVVPMGIAYSDDDACFGDESFGEHIQRISSMRGLRVAVHAGEPFFAGELEMTELKELGQARIQQAVNEARRRLG